MQCFNEVISSGAYLDDIFHHGLMTGEILQKMFLKSLFLHLHIQYLWWVNNIEIKVSGFVGILLLYHD